MEVSAEPEIELSEEATSDGAMAVAKLVLPLELDSEAAVFVEVSQRQSGGRMVWSVVEDFALEGGKLKIPIAKRLLGEEEEFPMDIAGGKDASRRPELVRVSVGIDNE